MFSKRALSLFDDPDRIKLPPRSLVEKIMPNAISRWDFDKSLEGLQSLRRDNPKAIEDSAISMAGHAARDATIGGVSALTATALARLSPKLSKPLTKMEVRARGVGALAALLAGLNSYAKDLSKYQQYAEPKE